MVHRVAAMEGVADCRDRVVMQVHDCARGVGSWAAVYSVNVLAMKWLAAIVMYCLHVCYIESRPFQAVYRGATLPSSTPSHTSLHSLPDLAGGTVRLPGLHAGRNRRCGSALAQAANRRGLWPAPPGRAAPPRLPFPGPGVLAHPYAPVLLPRAARAVAGNVGGRSGVFAGCLGLLGVWAGYRKGRQACVKHGC